MGCEFIIKGKKYSSIDKYYSEKNLTSTVNQDGSFVDLKKMGGLNGVTLNSNIYQSNEQQQLFEKLVVTIQDVTNSKIDYDTAINTILDVYSTDDYKDTLYSENDAYNRSISSGTPLGMAIFEIVDDIRNGKDNVYPQQMTNVAEWIYNIQEYIKDNSNTISDTVVGSIQSTIGNTESVVEEVSENIDVDNKTQIVERKSTSIITPELTLRMNDKYFGNARVRSASKYLTKALLDIMPYSNIVSLNEAKTINEAIFSVYNSFVKGSVSNNDLKNIKVTILRDGEKVKTTLSQVTREDVVNNNNENLYNLFILNSISNSVLKKEDGSVMMDEEVLYLMTLAIPNIDISRAISKHQQGLTSQKGGEKNFNQDGTDIDTMISENLNFVLNNMLIDNTDIKKGFHNGKQVKEFFKYIRTKLIHEGRGDVTFSELGSVINEMLNTGRLKGKYKSIGNSVYKAWFHDKGKIVNGKFIAPINLILTNSNGILTELKKRSSEDEFASYEDVMKNKLKQMKDLSAALTVWFNSPGVIQAEVMNVSNNKITTSSAISKTLDRYEHTNAMKDIWGVRNADETFALSPEISSIFFGKNPKVVVSDIGRDKKFKVTLDNGKDKFTYNYPFVNVFNNDIATKILLDTMIAIGYTDIKFMFDEITSNVAKGSYYFGGKKYDYDEVSANRDYAEMVQNIADIQKIALYNEQALIFIEQKSKILDDDSIDSLQKVELLKNIDTEYKKTINEKKLSMGTLPVDARYNGIPLYTPTSLIQNKFFDKYVNAVKDNSSTLMANQYTDASGNQQPLFTLRNQYMPFTYGQEYINKAFGDHAKTELGKLNPILNGKIRLDRATVHGGLMNDESGKKQKELDTAELIDSYFNIKMPNSMIDHKGDLNMVSFNGMMADRPMLWDVSYKYKEALFGHTTEHGEITYLAPKKDRIVDAFKDIAKMYQQRKNESDAKVRQLGLSFKDGYIVKKGVDNENNEVLVSINKSDKASYWGLIKNYDYGIDKDGNLIAGNAHNLTMSSLPISLINKLNNDTATYDDIVELYTQDEVFKLIDIIVDNKVSIRGLNNLLDYNTDTIKERIEKYYEERINKINSSNAAQESLSIETEINNLFDPIINKITEDIESYSLIRDGVKLDLENIKGLRGEYSAQREELKLRLSSIKENIKNSQNELNEVNKAKKQKLQSIELKRNLDRQVRKEKRRTINNEIKSYEAYQEAKKIRKELKLQNELIVKNINNELEEERRLLLEETVIENNEEIEMLSKNIKDFRTVLSSVLSNDTTKFGDLNPLFEYAIYSYLFYNTFVNEMSMNGSFYNSSITDFIKRGQGTTAPFMQTLRTDDGIGNHFNVIYREDSHGSYLDKTDSELHSNGEVLISPLTWYRNRNASGGDLSFIGNGGVIKTNYFNSGVKENMQPGYWKMSARSINSFDIKHRSKQSMDAIKIFLDKDILMKLYDEESITQINLFQKFESQIKKANTEDKFQQLVRDIDDYILTISENASFMDAENVGFEEESIYPLLPHLIVPTSAAKMYQQKVHDNTIVSTEATEEQFEYTLPTLNPFGGKSNSVTSMVRVSTEGFGIQNNKNHDVLPDKKPMPNQIIRFLGLRDQGLYNKIANKLASMTEYSIKELQSLIDAGNGSLINKYKNIAYSNSINMNLNASKTDLIGDINSKTVISKELVSAIMKDFKNSVKPDMVGGTFVQRASNMHVYEDANGNVFFADEIGAIDDYTDVEGYTRRRLRPFGYSINGKQIRSKEELVKKYLEDANSLEIVYQEVIMDFPYRERFGIGINQSLNDVMVINGISLKDGTTKITTEDMIIKIASIIEIQQSLNSNVEIEELFGSAFKILKFNDYIKDNAIDVNYMVQELANYYLQLNQALYVYPVRIPTTGMASGFPSRIVGFSNVIENTLIVPSEASILNGSDYDIDELHTLYKPFNVGWNDNIMELQSDLFDAIFEAYKNKDNLIEIVTEITYKDIQEANENKKNSDIKNVNSHTDFYKARQNAYDGNKLVGYEVNAQQSLLDFHITNQLSDKKIDTPFLNKVNGGVTGIGIAVDVLSSYVNMATDNDKLGGLIGELGHDGNLSTLLLGLAITGFNGDITTHEEGRVLLNAFITDNLTNPIIQDALIESKRGERISKYKKRFTRFDEMLYNKINSTIESKDKLGEDTAQLKTIKDALVIGTASYRLFQLDLMQADISSNFDVYNKVKTASFNLGNDIDKFTSGIITSVDEQKAFINSKSSFENAVRSIFNIQEYANKNPMKVQHLKMLSLIEKTVAKEIKTYGILRSIESKYYSRKGISSYRSKKMTEDEFNAYMTAIESIMVTDFIKTNKARYSYTMLDVPMYNKKGEVINETSSSYDLSNNDELIRFHTDFPKYIQSIKQKYVNNYFVSNLAIESSGSNKRIVTIRGSRAIDDGSIIDDIKRHFDNLTANERRNISIYAFITSGFNMNKSSLMRFIDNDIIKEYSKWENSLEKTLFDNMNDNLQYAIELSNPVLQIEAKQEKGKVGYNNKIYTNFGGYAPTYIDGNKIINLKTPPRSKILSSESLSRNGRIMDLTPQQERMIHLGFSIEIDYNEGRLDLKNTSYPKVYNSETKNYNDTSYNTVKLIENNGKYLLVPINESSEDTATYSNLAKSAASLFLDNISYGNDRTQMLENGSMIIGDSDNFMLQRMVSVYGLLPNLKGSNANNSNLAISNHVKSLLNNDIFKQVVKAKLGLNANTNTVKAFLSTNYERSSIEDAYMFAKNRIDELKNLADNEIISIVSSTFTNAMINDFMNYNVSVIKNILRSSDITPQIASYYLAKKSMYQLSLLDITQMRYDYEYINNIPSSISMLRPSEAAMAIKDELDKTKKETINNCKN